MLSQQSKEALRVLGVDKIAAKRFVQPDIDSFFYTVENEPGLLQSFHTGLITGGNARHLVKAFDVPFILVWKIAGRMVGIV